MKYSFLVPGHYGGTPTRAPVIKKDPEIGKSVPLEVVETSSFNLAKTIVQEGKLLQPLDLKIMDFGQGKLTDFVHRRLVRGSDVSFHPPTPIVLRRYWCIKKSTWIIHSQQISGLQ